MLCYVLYGFTGSNHSIWSHKENRQIHNNIVLLLYRGAHPWHSSPSKEDSEHSFPNVGPKQSIFIILLAKCDHWATRWRTKGNLSDSQKYDTSFCFLFFLNSCRKIKTGCYNSVGWSPWLQSRRLAVETPSMSSRRRDT